MHVMDAIRSWKEPLIDEMAAQVGAKCKLACAQSMAVVWA